MRARRTLLPVRWVVGAPEYKVLGPRRACRSAAVGHANKLPRCARLLTRLSTGEEQAQDAASRGKHSARSFLGNGGPHRRRGLVRRCIGFPDRLPQPHPVGPQHDGATAGRGKLCRSDVRRCIDTPHGRDGGLSALGISPEYSQTSSFNLDDSYLVLLWATGQFHLCDAAGNDIRAFPGMNEPRWSRTNPTHLYYRTGNQIMRVDAVTNQVVTIKTFSQYGAIHFGGSTGDLSDNDRITIVGDNRYISIYDLTAQTQFGVLDTNQAPVNGNSFNWATITKDGDRFVVGYNNGTNRGQGMELYDLNGNSVVQLQNARGHAAMGRAVDGTQVLFATNAATFPQQPAGCNNGLVKISLDATATRTCLRQISWGIAAHFSAHGNDG